MGVKQFSPLNGSGVFNISSDGGDSFGCSADFGWDHCATTPEITSVFSESDDVSFMANMNPAKKLKQDPVNMSWDASSIDVFLNADATQDGGNEVDLWSFSDIPSILDGMDRSKLLFGDDGRTNKHGVLISFGYMLSI
ncbi:hypothetical protein Hanom_Chr13g01208541 [Helianthus anomalus]